MFRIQAKNEYGQWDFESVGDSAANHFETEGEAEAAIESLKALGSEWADGEYRVVEE